MIGELGIIVTDSYLLDDSYMNYNYDSTSVEIYIGDEFQTVEIDSMFKLIILVDFLQGFKKVV